MLSGQPVHAIAAWDNAAEFPAAVPTIAHYLRLVGYRTILSGKMHFVGPDQLHGFDERLTTDIYPADFAWTPIWEPFCERIDKWYHGMDSLHEAGQALATYQIDYDTEVGAAAIRRLYDLARDRDKRPWLLCASFIHPHDPYVSRPEWWELYDHDEIDMPDPFDIETLDPHTQRIRTGIEADTVGYGDDHVRNARHAYYANVTYFDAWIGRLIAVVGETGHLANTVVIVTSDHGDMLGDRGAWFKMSFHERSCRVPLIMVGPGVRNTTVPNVCSHLDLLPTVLDIASGGAEWPELGAALAGRSLWEAACGGVDPIDETTGEYCAEMTSHPMFMIRRGRHKYIHCRSDPPQLYDLKSDPLERRNLAVSEDPGNRALAAAFAAEVAQRWDDAAIRDRVIASQRARHTVDASMNAGRRDLLDPIHRWDYDPPSNAADSYVRNHMDWSEVGPRSRFPRLG